VGGKGGPKGGGGGNKINLLWEGRGSKRGGDLLLKWEACHLRDQSMRKFSSQKLKVAGGWNQADGGGGGSFVKNGDFLTTEKGRQKGENGG